MYAVIFTAHIKSLDSDYASTADRLQKLAFTEYGCREFRSVLEGKLEITVSYWDDLDSIRAWKANAEHLRAQAEGKERWYQSFKVEIAKIEHSYGQL